MPHLPNTCVGCGMRAVVEHDLCVPCLLAEVEAEVCCPDPVTAGRRYCGCGGVAAMSLRLLRERYVDGR